MGKIIAVANQKGGVGKTTTAINLSAALGMMGYKTLLIDADPQGNATSGVGVNKRDVKMSVYDIMIEETPIEQCIVKTNFDNLWLAPCNIDLAGAELELVDMKNRQDRLKKPVSSIKNKFDFILMDCPPSLGLITLNALVAADTILVPIQTEYFALEGLSQLINTVRQVKKLYNSHIDIEGVLLTMFDGRLNLSMQVVREVKKYFPNKVYNSTIPRNVTISEAPSFGEPVVYFDKQAKGSVSYTNLAKEFIKKQVRS